MILGWLQLLIEGGYSRINRIVDVITVLAVILNK